MELICSKCGSDMIVPEAEIRDQRGGVSQSICAVYFKNPEALLFKDSVYAKITANICGTCGFVELYIKDAEEFYNRCASDEAPE